MTIASTTNRAAFTGNGVTTSFSFPYYVIAAADLKVYKNGTLQTLTTHYTLSGSAPYTSGTNVQFVAAPASADAIVILRDPAITQSVDLVENDPLPVDTAVERPLDKLTMIAQRLSGRLDLALHYADTDTNGGATLPALTERKGKYLGFDAVSGELSPLTGSGTPVDAALISYTPAGTGAVESSVRTRLRKSVYADEYPDLQTAYDTLGSSGGTIWLPNGTYGPITVTKQGVALIGESNAGVIITRTTGAAGLYAVDVNLFSFAATRSFVMENVTIQGLSAAHDGRIYNGLLLRWVFQPQIRGILYKNLDRCLTGRACYYGHFHSIWMQDYNVGIEGYNDEEAFNSNYLSVIQSFWGNDEGTAKPYDGTHAGANKWDVFAVGTSVEKPMDQCIAGDRDIFDNLRLETITSTNNWFVLRNNAVVNACTVVSQVPVADGMAPFSITGHGNVINELGSPTIGTHLVRFELGSSHNKVTCNSADLIGPAWLDFGTFNDKHISGDHEYGNELGACYRCTSDFEVTNLITRSIDLNNMVADGLTVAAAPSVTGVDGRGGVYLINTPTGNRQITQTIGAVTTDQCYCMSFEVQSNGAFSGQNEHDIDAVFSENPSADYDASHVRITANSWTRAVVFKKFGADWANAYFGIRLPAAHPGILLRNPQVVLMGSNATSGEFAPPFIGGTVRTSVNTRKQLPSGKAWEYTRGIPPDGVYYNGDEVRDLTAAATGDTPGYRCTATGEPGTWVAKPDLA